MNPAGLISWPEVWGTSFWHWHKHMNHKKDFGRKSTTFDSDKLFSVEIRRIRNIGSGLWVFTGDLTLKWCEESKVDNWFSLFAEYRLLQDNDRCHYFNIATKYKSASKNGQFACKLILRGNCPLIIPTKGICYTWQNINPFCLKYDQSNDNLIYVFFSADCCKRSQKNCFGLLEDLNIQTSVCNFLLFLIFILGFFWHQLFKS